MKPHILFLFLAFALPFSAKAQIQLTQERCRQMALAHDERLQQAAGDVEQARLDRELAAIAALPKLDGMAMGIYSLPDMDMMGMKLSMRGTYLAGITLTQPLYTGGKITAGKRLAAIGETAATEQQRLTRADVIVAADHAYFSYVAVLEKVKMMEAYKAQMDTLHQQTATAVGVGMATENDLLRITAKRSETLYQLQKAKSGAEICRLALANVIGAACSDSLLVVGDEWQADSHMDGSLALSNRRPELRLLESQISADRWKVKMARADMLPTVALSAGYSRYGGIKMKGSDANGNRFSQEYRDGNAMVMLSVNIPIFHWGETSKKVKKAKLSLRHSELELQRTTRLLSLETEQARCNLSDRRQLILSAQQALSQAEENLRTMRARYKSSMSPLTDLLDAYSLWQQARSNVIEAQAQAKIYETDYLRAAGALDD